MSSLEDRLKDNEYKLWVKTGICLGMVKTGLETFAEHRSTRMHGFVTDKVKTICPAAKITKKRGKWTTGCCANCQIYVDELVGFQCAPFEFRQSNWANSDISKWPKEPWEMAKVYMNPGQKPFSQQPSPRETDLSGLINFIDHCVVPRTDIQDKNNLTQVRDGRNKVMHSASMKLTQDEFDQHTDVMIKLLEDPLVLKQKVEAQNAADEIRRVQMVHFHISTTAELEVLRNKTTEIEAQGEHLREEIEQLKDTQERLESSTDEKMKSIRGLVERETDERENTIAALKEDISQKETRMKELTTELLNVKELMRKDKDLYRKLDTRVKNVETTLEKTNVEFKVIQQSHGTLMKQVAKIQSDLNAGITVDWNTDTDAEHMKENIVKLEIEKEKLREQVEYRDKEIEELKMKISSLEKEQATAKYQQASETTRDDTKGLETVDELHITLDRTKKEAAENKKEYEDKIEKLEYQNNKLKNELGVGRIKELEESLVDLESVLNESRLETETTCSHLKTYTSLYQQEKDSNKALKSDIERLKSDMNRDQKLFEMQIQSKEEEVENTLKSKEDMVANLLTECEIHRKTEKDLRIQQKQLASDLHEKGKKIIELEKIIEQLNHNITKHKHSEYFSRGLLDKIANQKTELDKQNQNLDRQKLDLDLQKQEVDQKKRDLDLQKQDVDRQKQEFDRMMEKLEQRNRMTEELERLNQELDAQKQYLDRQKQDVDRQIQEFDRQTQGLDRQKQELNARKQYLDRQKQDVDRQKQEFDRQTQGLDRQKQELDAQKQYLDRQKQEFDRQKQEFDRQTQGLVRQKRELDAQKQYLDRQKQYVDRQKQEFDQQTQGLDRQKQELNAQKQELDRQKKGSYRQTQNLDARLESGSDQPVRLRRGNSFHSLNELDSDKHVCLRRSSSLRS